MASPPVADNDTHGTDEVYDKTLDDGDWDLNDDDSTFQV